MTTDLMLTFITWSGQLCLWLDAPGPGPPWSLKRLFLRHTWKCEGQSRRLDPAALDHFKALGQPLTTHGHHYLFLRLASFYVNRHSGRPGSTTLKMAGPGNVCCSLLGLCLCLKKIKAGFRVSGGSHSSVGFVVRTCVGMKLVQHWEGSLRASLWPPSWAVLTWTGPRAGLELQDKVCLSHHFKILGSCHFTGSCCPVIQTSPENSQGCSRGF